MKEAEQVPGSYDFGTKLVLVENFFLEHQLVMVGPRRTIRTRSWARDENMVHTNARKRTQTQLI